MSNVNLVCEKSFSAADQELVDIFIEFQHALIDKDLVKLNEMILDASDFINVIGNHYVQRQRQTLGVAYYPDAFTLKCRAAEARQKLLESFGLSEDIIRLAISRQRFGGLKSTVRMIARMDKLDKDGRLKAMNELIVDERAQRVICDIQSHGSLKEHLFAFLFKHKCVRLLLWLFN